MIAKIATEMAADRLFDYNVPPELESRIRLGQRVRVPFGSREVTGYVMELATATELPPPSPKHRASLQVERQLDLFAPPAPSPASPSPAPSSCASQFCAAPETAPSPAPQFCAAPETARLKSLRSIEDDVPFFSETLLRLSRWMAEYFYSPVEKVLKCILPASVRNPTVHEKQQLYVEAVAQEKITEKLTARQTEILEGIRRVGGGWLSALPHEFSCSEQLLKTLAEKGAVTIEKVQRRRDPLARRKVLPTQPLPLMPEQAAALRQIVGMLDTPAERKPVLLFGVTGSGKTEIYLQAIAHVLERGEGAIVMVPEIALTPQTVQRFASRFGNRIAVLHSALGDGERFDEWHRIRTGEAQVVVGPRSAVFAPVQRLGLIVVDEEHEPSYKQEDAPRYHGRDVAVMRAHLEGCCVVLGSATPSMESWRNVAIGKYAVAKLTERVQGRPMPSVRVVDMRLETARTGHAQIFSEELLEALKLRLERGEQSILFLNRRGYSTSLTCPRCGYTAECDQCSVSYTYHKADDCLRCHICGAWKRIPQCCPECGDPAFRFAGFGTQRAESALSKCFPSARVLRMDADVTSRKHSHDELLSIFRSGRADILIGTQMIAKGLDFPNVTLVGVLLADTSLSMPDFRASERSYQLLAQVSGRAGRAELPGEVIIQTYNPEHPAVSAAAGDDGFEPFASSELAERAKGGYPPYAHLTCVTLKGADEERLQLASEAFEKALRECAAPYGDKVRISEALPAALAKAKGLFRYQILLFAPTTRAITAVIRAAMARRGTTRSAGGISIEIDIDALAVG